MNHINSIDVKFIKKKQVIQGQYSEGFHRDNEPSGSIPFPFNRWNHRAIWQIIFGFEAKFMWNLHSEWKGWGRKGGWKGQGLFRVQFPSSLGASPKRLSLICAWERSGRRVFSDRNFQFQIRYSMPSVCVCVCVCKRVCVCVWLISRPRSSLRRLLNCVAFQFLTVHKLSLSLSLSQGESLLFISLLMSLSSFFLLLPPPFRIYLSFRLLPVSIPDCKDGIPTDKSNPIFISFVLLGFFFSFSSRLLLLRCGLRAAPVPNDHPGGIYEQFVRFKSCCRAV